MINIQSTSSKQPSKNRIKILIVEDEVPISKYLSIILKNIDLILINIKMLLVNGYEATKKIQEFDSKITIIAQTAFAMANDKEKILASGFNNYISKPINKHKLIDYKIKIVRYFALKYRNLLCIKQGIKLYTTIP